MVRKHLDAWFDFKNMEQLKCLISAIDAEEFGDPLFFLHIKTIPTPRRDHLKDYYLGWRDPLRFEEYRDETRTVIRKDTIEEGLKVLDNSDDNVNFAHLSVIFPNEEGKIPHAIKARHFKERDPGKGEGVPNIVDAQVKDYYFRERYANMIMVLVHERIPGPSVRSRYHRILTNRKAHMGTLSLDCRKCSTREKKSEMRATKKDPNIFKCTNEKCGAEIPHPKWKYTGRTWKNIDWSHEYDAAMRTQANTVFMREGQIQTTSL